MCYILIVLGSIPNVLDTIHLTIIIIIYYY